jgi:hypothetical protein
MVPDILTTRQATTRVWLSFSSRLERDLVRT